MLPLLFIVLPILCLAIITLLVSFSLSKTNLDKKEKRKLFIIATTLLSFPVILPAGTISGFPVPNILAIGLILCFSFSDILQLPIWYAKTWFITLPSLGISNLIVRAIAACIYYETKETKAKS